MVFNQNDIANDNATAYNVWELHASCSSSMVERLQCQNQCVFGRTINGKATLQAQTYKKMRFYWGEIHIRPLEASNVKNPRVQGIDHHQPSSSAGQL